MRALGIDLGSKRIGVAVCDSAGTLATPVDTVARCGDRRREHAEIARLVAEWSAEIVVVGLPISLDGSCGPAAKAAAAEIEALNCALEVAVVAYDERLTTLSAERSLMSQSLKGPAKRKVIDRLAAAVMLQSWLDAGRPADCASVVDG